MRVGVLGPVSVDGDDRALSRRDRVVLAALTVRADGPIGADHLRDALWGGEPPPSSAKIIQGCVVRLRKLLGAQAIETLAEGYRLTLAGDDVDAHRFERLLHRGAQLLALDEPERAAHALNEALALWRGPALADLDGWDAGRIERERLGELRCDAEELRLDAGLRSGRASELLADALRLVNAMPVRERRWALLARAQYQAGRQADALQTLHRARVRLSTELGLDPGPELVALQEQILRHDTRLAVPAPPREPSPACPYLGLVPYDVADADAFFGRADDVEACLRRLAAEGVIAVVGPSGSGKSSLVRAGLVARLQRTGRAVTVISPGARPMDALTSLPSSGPPPVLVVDQLEAAVALCADADERAAFFQALADHADRAPLIMALRADWLGEVSADPNVARLVERGLYLIGPMRPDDLRQAVEGPALQAGLLVEPGLADLLVREVEGQPGALPLLSHALRTTWARREGRTLTVSGYTDSGGIRGAVAQTAEAVYARIPGPQRPLVRDLLLRLVTPTPGGAAVRTRLSRRLVPADRQHTALVELLVAERLVTTDGDVIELAHEALTRAWPRLQAWLDDDAAGQRIRHHISVAADIWDQMGRPHSELYRGVRLAEAVDWRDRTRPRLAPLEEAFLDAGAALAEAERRAAAERAQRQAQVNRRLRALLIGVGVLSLVAAAAGLLAGRQARRADAAAVAADARRVGAQALAADDVDRSLLLAVAGVRLEDSPDTRANLLAALGRSPALIGVIRSEGSGAFGAVTVGPDGQTLAVHDDENRTWFYDAGTRAARGSVANAATSTGRAALVTGRAAFAPGGRAVAVSVSAAGERPVRLLDPRSLQELPDQLGGFPSGHLLPWDLAYSPDGDRLAVVLERHDRYGVESLGSTVVIWDTARPAEPLAVLPVAHTTHGLAFSPDGRLLYTATHLAPPMFDGDPSVTVYDVASGRTERTIDGPGHPFALSPDGTVIAAPTSPPASGDPGARTAVTLWDVETGAERRRLTGHAEQVLDVAFSPDGTLLASSSADRTVAVWDVGSGERREQLEGHAGAVSSVAFDPQGRTLYSAGTDRAVLTWDLAGDRRAIPVRSVEGEVLTRGQVSTFEPHAVLSPAGDRAVFVQLRLNEFGRPRAAMQMLDVGRARAGPVLDEYHGEYAVVAWHPGGRRFASVGVDAVVRVWDADTGDVVVRRRLPFQGFGLAYLGHDELLVAASSGLVQRIDADTLEPVADPFAIPMVGAYSYTAPDVVIHSSPDRRTAAVITDGSPSGRSPNLWHPNNRLLLLEVRSGRVLRERDLGFDAHRAAFSPDGERIAVAGRGGEVAVVDAATARPVRSPVIGHDGNVASVDYAPDGSTVVSGGLDGTVSLWDGVTGDLVGTVRIGRPTSEVYAGFEPDGHTVSIVNWDGQAHTLDTRSARWADVACRIAGRDLTSGEWREAFGDRPYRQTCPSP